MPPGRSSKWRGPGSRDSCGSIPPITEILAIEDHKLNSTFLHVAIGSQSLLKPIDDQIGSNTNSRTGEGDQRRMNESQSKFIE
jgi:hypothetical protein